MGLRTRVKRLEQKTREHYDVLLIPGEPEIFYTAEDGQAAFFAALDQEEHWLLPYFRRAEPTVPLVALIQMLTRSGDGS